MFNIFVSPGEVFGEIAAQPSRLATWLVPTTLVCLVATAYVHPEVSSHADNSPQNISSHSHFIAALDSCLGIFLGTLWCAFALWLIGRFCLKTRFSILKSLEITGLASTILILSAIVTGLLSTVSGDGHARPALSIFLNNKYSHPVAYAILDALNVFNIWITTVLAIGLAKLSGVSVKECAFWVFGYWLVVRVGLILLA